MTGTGLAAAATGFALGLTLIIAIGAQNAFVLRQGLRREHVVKQGENRKEETACITGS
jgi:L-lysine exporter family protein LysE/ArgO